MAQLFYDLKIKIFRLAKYLSIARSLPGSYIRLGRRRCFEVPGEIFRLTKYLSIVCNVSPDHSQGLEEDAAVKSAFVGQLPSQHLNEQMINIPVLVKRSVATLCSLQVLFFILT